MFTDSIIIEFSADVSELAPAIDALAQLGVVDKKVADQFKKTNQDFAERNKSIGQLQNENKKLQGSLDDLLKKFNGLSESIKKGTINEALKDFVKTQQAAKDTGTVFTKLKAEYNALVAEAVKAGGAQTEAGKKILEQAGRVQDKIADLRAATRRFASDTSQFDAILGGLNTIASGFQVAQGAAHLFGKDNEDLQKTFVQLQAVMAVTNGLQQIQNNLQKESALSLRLLTPLQNAWTNGIFGSGAAMQFLSKAFLATGIGALIVLLPTLIANFDEIKIALGGLSKEQKLFNELQNKSIDNSSTENTHLQLLVSTAQDTTLSYQARKDAVDELQKTYPDYLRNLTVENASSDEIANTITGKLIPALLAKARAQAAEEKLVELTKEQLKLQEESVDGIASQNALSEITFGIISSHEEKLKKNKEQIDLITQAYFNAAEAASALGDPHANNTEKELKQAKAVADAKVILTKEGSSQELQAKIRAVEADKKLQLENATLTTEGRQAIEADALKKENQLRADFRKKQIDDNKALAEAELAQAQEGSKAASDARIKILEDDRASQLTNIHLTANERKKIEAETDKAIAEERKKFAFEQTQQQLDIDKNVLLTRKALIIDDAKASLDIQKDIIENEADAKKLAAQNSIHDKAALDAEIARIDAESLRAKTDADKAAHLQELQDALDLANKKIDIEITAQNAIANGPESSVEQKKTANEKILSLEKYKITNQLTLLADEHAQGLISEKDYQDQLLQLTNDRIKNQLDSEAQASEERKQIDQAAKEFLLSSVQEILDAQFAAARDALQSQTDAKIAALEKEKEAELNQGQILTAEQKRRNDINEKFRKKEAAIKLDAWKKQKEADKTEAEINGLLAILKIAATAGNPYVAAILIAAQIIATAAIISQIDAKPAPQFRSGKEKIEGPGTGTSDSIFARLSVGERVVTADVNKDYFPALSAIHNRKVKPEFANMVLTDIPQFERSFLERIPVMNHLDEDYLNTILVTNTSSTNFDYEKLSDLLSKKMNDYMKEYNYQSRKEKWAMQDFFAEALKKNTNTYDPRRN